MPDPARNFERFKASLENSGFTVSPHSAPWRPTYVAKVNDGMSERLRRASSEVANVNAILTSPTHPSMASVGNLVLTTYSALQDQVVTPAEQEAADARHRAQ